MFDYIIIGAGSAGGVLANRLSEDPKNQVCLIEAGSGDNSLIVDTPGAFGVHMFWRKFNWGFTSQPDNSADQRSHFCPRGKGLGGSSMINGMVYTRGHSSDYDAWEKLGNTGWGFDDVLPYFIKSEDNSRGKSEYHGKDGLLTVSDIPKNYYPIENVFMEAAQQAGLPLNHDFNNDQLDGVGNYQFTIRNGKRSGVGSCFIRPAMQRSNLTIISEARASKLLFEGKKAVGVAYHQSGETKQVYAAKEVILSGGALNSPQLLMLSGVGDTEHLSQMGIETHHHLQGVGKNLQDHPEVPLVYKSLRKDGYSLSSIFPRVKEGLQYLLGKNGPIQNSITAVGGFYKSSDDVAVADVQIHFLPLMFADHGRNIEYLIDHGFSAHVNVARPKSRGFVQLRNNDPMADPLIQLNLLSHPDDMDVLLKAVKKMRTIIGMSALDSHRGEEVFPGKHRQNDEEIMHGIRQNVSHVYHPVGTCKMGQDSMAVVDDKLRVHGLESLRIVDASIMPTLVSANTNAPTIMIAEKAADMILSAAKGV